MTEIRLSQEQLDSLAASVRGAAHDCPFSQDQIETLHLFCGTLNNGGWQKWGAILDFGGTLIQAKRAGVVAVVTLLTGAVVTAVWAGIKHFVHQG